MKIYKHYNPKLIWAPVVMLGVIEAGLILGLIWSIARTLPNGPPPPVFLLASVVVGYNLWLLGGNALEIRHLDDGYLEFSAPLRKARVYVLEIESIGPSKQAHGFGFVLRYRGGAVRFDPRLNGMHELIGDIKRQNPSVQLR